MNYETPQATEFLKLLDPSTNKFTFQTFGEGKKRGKKHLTKLLHGTFDEHHDKLLELNAQGAGVFVTINKTDGKGRKAENIVDVRALWQEDDNEWEGDFPLPR